MTDTFERLKAALADRYTIERELGAGGMATVYLAEDLKHHRKVAVKVLLPELAAAIGPERFLREIEIAANLTHPHILPLHDSGEADGFLYYVMPFIQGETLRNELDRDGQLPIDEAVRLAALVASALDYAHRQGVIHRDIKPENILLHDGQPIVADFGIALAVSAAGGARLTQTGFSTGTPAYMSPEQAAAERELDARSDVYSLASVLYEMLTGETPHTGSTAQSVIAKLMTERPTPPRTLRHAISDSVDAAVMNALSTSPVDRFGSASEFAKALTDDSLPEESIGAGAKKTAVRAGVAALLVFAIAGMGIAIRSLVGPGSYVVENPRRSMVIFPFAVTARDTLLDWLAEGAATMLTTNLEGWQELRVVDRRQLASLGRSLDVTLDDADLTNALTVSRAARVGTVLLGEILGQGGNVEIAVRVYDVASGETLRDPARATGIEADVRPLLDSIGAQILDISGAPTIGPDIRAATTNSLQAYREYLGGLRHLYRWELGEADVRFRAAIDEDSTFALAYHRLALALSLQADRSEAEVRELTTAAVRHADRLPWREQQHVQAFNAFQHDDNDLARQTYRDIVATDSSDAEAWYHLGEVEHHDLTLVPHADGRLLPRGNLNEALRAFARAVEIDPGFHLGYGHSFEIYRWALSISYTCGESGCFSPDWRDSIVWDTETNKNSRNDSVATILRDRYVATAQRWVNAAPDEARPHAVLRDHYVGRSNTLDLALAEDRAYLRLTRDTVPEDRFRLANLYLAAGIYDTAAALTEQGLASLPREPGSPTPPYMAANVFIARGQPSRALEVAAGDGSIEPRGASMGSVALQLREEVPVLRAIEVLGSTGANRRALRAAVDSLRALLAPPRHTPEEIEVFNELEAPGIDPGLLVLGEELVREWYGEGTGGPLWARAYLQFHADGRAAAARTIEQALDAWRELQQLNEALAQDPSAERTVGDLTQDASGARRALIFGTAPKQHFLLAHIAQALDLDSLAIEFYVRMDPWWSQQNLSSLLPASGSLPYAVLGLDGDWGLLSLSYLGRARSYEALGDSPNAVEYYERFLRIWRDAEPDLQHYNEEARRGLARLGRAVEPS